MDPGYKYAATDQIRGEAHGEESEQPALRQGLWPGLLKMDTRMDRRTFYLHPGPKRDQLHAGEWPQRPPPAGPKPQRRLKTRQWLCLTLAKS